MSSDVVRIKLWIEMRAIAGSTQEDVVEIPREEWDAMTQEAREECINTHVEVFMSNEVEAGGYVEGEG